MRVTFKEFKVLSTSGNTVATLNGEYEATAKEEGQPGWYELKEVDGQGNVGDENVANVHITGNRAT
jgi:hypothetical protein